MKVFHNTYSNSRTVNMSKCYKYMCMMIARFMDLINGWNIIKFMYGSRFK